VGIVEFPPDDRAGRDELGVAIEFREGMVAHGSRSGQAARNQKQDSAE
jgi:hypothetical protein